MEPSFILALFQHGYKARTSTLYHLLKGKRTSSVLLYGFIYENLRFFQLFPALSEKQFNAILDELIEQKLLHQTSDGEVQITTHGLESVKRDSRSFWWLDNYRFGKTDETIWRLLQFTVQVISNLSYSHKEYIPLEQSPLYQKRVKMYIQSMPKVRLIETVKKEWTEIFSLLPKEEADFFAQQFSGYKKIGKTSFQLMDSQDTSFNRFLSKKERLHHLLDTILAIPEDRFLKSLITQLVAQNDNKSMMETSFYLKTQLTIETLALQRNVKVSTIKDHLMELALTKDFPFERFISQKTQMCLFDISKPYQEWTYRTLKQINPELDYFEFRLYQIQKLRQEREASQ
ncbi:helix-turn-helix domain-containing protein [Enterococcus caccae]|uniref:Helicase Helix-turn-helix domain-containing protein n=1 Tax=Enterococcus caccae ATCC BAA-1240 TaxID=1158612 RepID=R3TT11_9ENTE|nr:helix-turn-helix domain-containing protein [Enterococcus caccae]EOL44308.1 hypothetical protein UC7_02352 [Enterococcus caccae ATCC BAA-1240]EOT68576.1 hypothetical protein I580_00959 [Enterococcus caccae ATCC BAA-1240]